MTIVSKYFGQLKKRDSTLTRINLAWIYITDATLVGVVDYLIAYPNGVMYVHLDGNQLTDESGVKLNQYIVASTTIKTLSLTRNQFGSATYLAIAAALRVNSSLHELFLNDNQIVDETCTNLAFVNALRLNSVRPSRSSWCLYSFRKNVFSHLNHIA